MGTIYLRGKTYWVDFRDQRGRRHRRSAKTDCKKRAKALLAKLEAAAFDEVHFPGRVQVRLTVDELRARWFQARGRKKSIAADFSRFDRIVRILGPNTRVATIEPRDIERMIAFIENEGLSHASINHHCKLLKAALRLAEREGCPTLKPFEGVRPLHEEERDRICTRAEYRKLIAGAGPTPLRLAIVIGYWTGMRLGEIVSMRWPEVDLERGLWRLRSIDAKTGYSRLVPFAPAALEVLREAAPEADSEEVIPHRPDSVSKMFTKLVRELGIRDLRFHDLRHTAATRMRRDGVDLITIAQITGHKELETLRRYMRIDEDDLLRAVGHEGASRE